MSGLRHFFKDYWFLFIKIYVQCDGVKLIAKCAGDASASYFLNEVEREIHFGNDIKFFPKK